MSAQISQFEPINKAYAAGLQAYRAGVALSANPYPYGTFKIMWSNGWADASFGARA